MRSFILIVVLFLAGCQREHPMAVFSDGDKVRLKGYSQVMVVARDNGYSVNVIWLDTFNQPQNYNYRHDMLERCE